MGRVANSTLIHCNSPLLNSFLVLTSRSVPGIFHAGLHTFCLARMACPLDDLRHKWVQVESSHFDCGDCALGGWDFSGV
eukprot:1148381-Pelagomonas_calceolata.AAC.1